MTKDPLILYGGDNAEVSLGAAALKKLVFKPTPMTMQWLTAGNGQTILCELKDIVQRNLFGKHVYTKSELFTLSDGG